MLQHTLNTNMPMFYTMEPSNKGHIGASNFVLCTEVVLTSGVKNALELYFGAHKSVLCRGVVPL